MSAEFPQDSLNIYRSLLNQVISQVHLDSISTYIYLSIYQSVSVSSHGIIYIYTDTQTQHVFFSFDSSNGLLKRAICFPS